MHRISGRPYSIENPAGYPAGIRVGNKKNPPNKTPKNPPKKTHLTAFFLGFIGFF
jgi:hypothetical protein